jgi:3-hydroxyisobutyrate dehydrogenase-like beta-hydroxyacid dehydrogenase
MKVGVVGIGKMGRPIANRLITAGHDVAICNRSENAGVDALRDKVTTGHSTALCLSSRHSEARSGSAGADRRP